MCKCICIIRLKIKQHLLGQYDWLLQSLSRVKSHLGLVLKVTSLVHVHAGVDSVCNEDFSHTHQSDGAFKVFNVVKVFVHFTLDFILPLLLHYNLNHFPCYKKCFFHIHIYE